MGEFASAWELHGIFFNLLGDRELDRHDGRLPRQRSNAPLARSSTCTAKAISSKAYPKWTKVFTALDATSTVLTPRSITAVIIPCKFPIRPRRRRLKRARLGARGATTRLSADSFVLGQYLAQCGGTPEPLHVYAIVVVGGGFSRAVPEPVVALVGWWVWATG